MMSKKYAPDTLTVELPFTLVPPPTHHAAPCPTCWTILTPRQLRVFTIHCNFCRGEMRFALVKGTSFYGPHQFLQQEIDAARRAGVVLHAHYNPQIKCGYLSAICPHCSAPFGKAYPRQSAHLEDLWLVPLNIPTRPLHMIETGHDCGPCNHHYGYPVSTEIKTTTNEPHA